MRPLETCNRAQCRRLAASGGSEEGQLLALIHNEAHRIDRGHGAVSDDKIFDMPSQTSLLGAAGEHYVMSELLRRGYIAALAPQGVPNADIVVCNVEGTQLASIQVKTRRDRGGDGGWHMKAKHEDVRSDMLFYSFVDFGADVGTPAVVYVIPSPRVAEVLAVSHRKWLATPGRNGQAHNDTPIRRLLPD
jgi:hypothetical protein